MPERHTGAGIVFLWILVIINLLGVIALTGYVFMFVGKDTEQTPTTTTTTSTTTTTGETSSSTATPETQSVTIKTLAFSPASLTVSAGTKVTWTNNDTSTHSVTSTGNFDSGDIEPGDTWSYTFNNPGTYTYSSSANPAMTGTVVVTQ